MVEDLNDDEVMELCILSNESNACETTAILNPSKFASCATRLGLREGFAVDLTTARANGTMWDLSLEDDRAELRRVQDRDHPELLAGSPPSDDFASLSNTHAEPREISKFKQRELSHRSELVCKPTSCRCKCGSTSFMNIPKIPRAAKCLRFNPLVNDPRVYSIDGPMCRWSLKARGSNERMEFIRNQTRWLTSFLRKLLEYFVEMIYGNATGDLFT